MDIIEFVNKAGDYFRAVNDQRILVVAFFCAAAEVIRPRNHDRFIDDDDLMVHIAPVAVQTHVNSCALQVVEQLQLTPADFLFVGDTAVDMKTAIAAGMFPAGALWGFRPEELKENGARELISSPTELLKLLDSPEEQP